MPRWWTGYLIRPSIIQKSQSRMTADARFASLAARLGDWLYDLIDGVPVAMKWPATAAIELVIFGIKQAWACLFAGLMLALMIGTSLFYPDTLPLHRYDLIFLSAILIQITMLVTGLESPKEAMVIAVYHMVGTAMEIFKVSVGSWIYPEDAVFVLYGVPLFSGFMYASIGSYLARVQHILDLTYTHYPPRWITGLLALLIYCNFFGHHFIWDFRNLLFLGAVLIYARTRVHFRNHQFTLRMPLPVGLVLVAFFLWLAENIGTLTGVWLYPHQVNGWTLVPFAKMGSWLLLMIVSFVLVSFVIPPKNQPKS